MPSARSLRALGALLMSLLVAGTTLQSAGASEAVSPGLPASVGATNDNGQRKLVMTSDGSLALIYDRTDGDVSQVFVATTSDEGRTWTEPVRLSRPAITSRLGSLAEDADGRLHAVWVDYETVGQVWYSVRDQNGVWSESSKISPGATYAGFPVIAADQDRTHVLWYSSVPDDAYDVGSRYEIVHRMLADGAWQTPTVISVGGLDALNPAIARDRDGVVHGAWYERDIGRYQVHAATHEEGRWNVATVLSPDTSDALGVAMDVGPDGTVHIVWEQVDEGVSEIMYAAWAGAWTEPVKVADAPAVDPVVATTDDGTLYLAWSDRDSIFLRHRSGHTWSEVEALGPGAHPTLAPGSRAYLAWTRPAVDDYEVVLVALGEPPGSGSAAIWAVVLAALLVVVGGGALWRGRRAQ